MHNIQLGYLEKFIQFYNDITPLFALTWFTEIGHDYINQVEIADEDFEVFLFILGDHGHRFDDIIRTSIGRMEERLPFFSMSLPKNIRQQRKDIMNVVNKNSNALTSFWNFYVTLKDITNMDNNDFFEYNQSSIIDVYSKRGESLLRPINDKRNCKDANIPEEFCPCQQEISLPINDERSNILSRMFINYSNFILYNNTNVCEKLEIKKIHNIKMLLPFTEEKESFFQFI
uniref:Uncharacterized protein n=1 Tax=Strongyloides papillosus TaxID=174720 RepID=A0A0N5BD43_STREA